jgi:hypothetical protein
MVQSNYFMDYVASSLGLRGVSLETIYSWQKSISVAHEARDFKRLHAIKDELVEKFMGFDGKPIDAYLTTLKSQQVVHSQKGAPRRNIAPYYAALIAQLKDSDQRFEMFKLDVDLSYAESCELSRKLSEDTASSNEDEIKLPFMVSSSFKESGHVLSKLYGSQRSISLVSLYKGKDGLFEYNFFGSFDKDLRNSAKIAEFETEFWVYRFESTSGSKCILFSKDELDLQECTIRGMVIVMRDKAKIGEFATIPSNMPVVFIYDQQSSMHQLSDDEFAARVKGLKWDEEALCKHVFGDFRHPQFFERFMLAWLFSAKYGAPPFPLHFGWLSVAGGGKSTMMESFEGLVGEPIAGGGGTTLKGLVPNYGGMMPDEGFLCQRSRLGLVDEFFAIMRRQSRSSETDTGTDLLQEILEHRSRISKSGRGEQGIIVINPKMKVLFATNTAHYHMLRNMTEMAQNMNRAFLSRVLWYVQTQQHVDFINRRKGMLTQREQVATKCEPWFLELFDYCYLHPTLIDENKVSFIVKEQLPLVPEALTEVYQARMQHHVTCLVDGVAKLNYLTGKKEKLEVGDEDYAEASTLLSIVIASWNDGVDMMKIPKKARHYYLSIEIRDIYDYICAHEGITIDGVKSIFGDSTRTQAKVNFLKNYQLIYESLGTYSPWWVMKGVEVDVSGQNGSAKGGGLQPPQGTLS